jgi:hypothetical protein
MSTICEAVRQDQAMPTRGGIDNHVAGLDVAADLCDGEAPYIERCSLWTVFVSRCDAQAVRRFNLLTGDTFHRLVRPVDRGVDSAGACEIEVRRAPGREENGLCFARPIAIFHISTFPTSSRSFKRMFFQVGA